MATLHSPVEGFTGDGPAGLRFRNGKATTDDPALIAYARRRGYGVDTSAPPPPEPVEPVDPREVEVEQVGTALRDAAVDPRPSDTGAPSGAGEVNPHGPESVAPGIAAEPVEAPKRKPRPAARRKTEQGTTDGG
ncbi:hypothetical protein ACIQFU_28135 [Streptomyces sp. NPDC093065]|uniref:hypothetical protein n=1 Tax=Streptomyces sp. NPDC093065 TaxID=3366021 RepID=UPI003830504F